MYLLRACSNSARIFRAPLRPFPSQAGVKMRQLQAAVVTAAFAALASLSSAQTVVSFERRRTWTCLPGNLATPYAAHAVCYTGGEHRFLRHFLHRNLRVSEDRRGALVATLLIAPPLST